MTAVWHSGSELNLSKFKMHLLTVFVARKTTTSVANRFFGAGGIGESPTVVLLTGFASNLSYLIANASLGPEPPLEVSHRNPYYDFT